MNSFSPCLPEEWRYRREAIFLPDDLERLRYDADLFIADWCDWQIWLDGGREVSIWLCTLVAPGQEVPRVSSEGVQMVRRAPEYVMRDFVDTTEQVQSWLYRATRAAKLLQENRSVNKLRSQ